MTKRHKKPELIDQIDKFGQSLIEAVESNNLVVPEEGGEPQKIAVKDKTQVFNALVRWILVRHKVWPEGKEESGLDELIRELNADTSADSGKVGGA